MFAQNQIFSIHLKNQPCSPSTSTLSLSDSLTNSINDFLKTNFPKQKFLGIIFDPLIKKNLITPNFYFSFDPKVHIIDFTKWINNKFYKNDNPPPHLKSVIKHLQVEKIQFPVSCVQNPLAKRLLC